MFSEVEFDLFVCFGAWAKTKMLVTCQRFGDSFLFGLVWQYSSDHKTYNKGRFKVIATYLQQ